VRDARAHLTAAGIAGEIIVCDNGSSDGSETVAGGAGARVLHEADRGYGSALRTGIRAAQGEYIVMLDSDGSYDLAAIRPMVDALRSGADLVVGNRFRGRLAPGSMPWLHRYLGSPMLSGLLNLLFGIHPRCVPSTGTENNRHGVRERDGRPRGSGETEARRSSR
jgi:glycosyltransferase involved in cell wall biosynthesis